MKLLPPRIALLFAAVVSAALAGAALSSRLLEQGRRDAVGVASTWRVVAASEGVLSLARQAVVACGEAADAGPPAPPGALEARRALAGALERWRTALAAHPGRLEAAGPLASEVGSAIGSPRLCEAWGARAWMARLEAGFDELLARVRGELELEERAAARSASLSRFAVLSTDAALLLLAALAAGATRGHLRLRARREAEHRHVLELQQQLLGIVGHDLRTPLSAIAGSAAQLARAPDLSSGRARAVQRILSSTGRMSRLVRDLLDYTRARVGGGLPVSPEPADVGEVCRRVVQEVRAARPDSVVLLAEEGDLTGEWDPARLEQVFSNLVVNACHHGVAATPVRVRAAGCGGRVVVEVHNQGPPIAPVELPFIFDPFRRGEASGHADAGGSLGLGLFIARSLVEAHGGDIEVASGAGGTTFRVTLPRRPCEGEAPGPRRAG